jgi:hypothetical protein
MKDENGDLLADSHNILNWWKNYSLLLSLHKISDVRQIGIYAAELSVPGPFHFEVDIAVTMLKNN